MLLYTCSAFFEISLHPSIAKNFKWFIAHFKGYNSKTLKPNSKPQFKMPVQIYALQRSPFQQRNYVQLSKRGRGLNVPGYVVKHFPKMPPVCIFESAKTLHVLFLKHLCFVNALQNPPMQKSCACKRMNTNYSIQDGSEVQQGPLCTTFHDGRRKPAASVQNTNQVKSGRCTELDTKSSLWALDQCVGSSTYTYLWSIHAGQQVSRKPSSPFQLNLLACRT